MRTLKITPDTWFTADTHFGHGNIIRYCKRPFSSVKEMDDQLVYNWNSVVPKQGTVFHLGDFAMKMNPKMVSRIISSLNGRIFLLRGSHDKCALSCGKLFEGIFTAELIKIGKQPIFLAHHCHKVWPRSHFNSWHLFGHSHGGLDKYAEETGKLLDVGVDSHEFRPWSFKEIEEVMANRPNNFNFIVRKK